MKIKSPAFENEQEIPQKYTCDGEDINPPFEISEVPEKAKSLVLIANDPDAPSGVFTHWLVWNINPETKEIKENSVPQGAISGKTNFGKNKYGGPCPPYGVHRYFFKIYALDITLDFPEGSSKSALENALEGHIIAQAELMGIYQR